MSELVPRHIGELSRYRLEQAIDELDQALEDAPQQLRDAVSIVRLVTGVPRRSPWYGVPIDPDDNGATVGVVLKNQVQLLEITAWRAGQQGHDYREEIRRSCRSEAARLTRRIDRGKREYDDYLHQLTDPERHERETKERRLRAEQVEAIMRQARSYRGRS